MAVNKGKEVAASNTTSGGKRRKSMCSRPESSGKGAKRRRQDVLKFVDDTAMEDEDDSDGMSFIDDLVDDDGEELDQGHTRDVKLGLKHTKSSSRLHHPLFLKEENMSIEEHEALIKERYSRHVTYEDEKEHINEIYLYTSKDPSIWKVNCMIGREQRIAFSLFQKYIDLQNFGNKLPIISVFAPEHVKGCVYIEAEKEADVTEACKGFYVLYNKKTSVTKDEIPGLLSVKTALNRLSEGTWVRVKSGNYKGDLAQVVAFDDQHKRAMVKLIPRIDLQALSKKFGGGVSLKESGIPKPRLISSWELEDFRPHIQIRCDRLTGENFEVLDGMMLKEGYVYKKVSVASLNWLGVQPSRNELMKFEAAKMDDAEDLNWLSLVNGERKKVCLEGSNVGLENNEGNHYQLNDLVLFGQKEFGVIISIKGDSIQILKGDTERTQLATVLRKYIRTTCVDKMFTASDCHKKNIAINDIVKVLEGPSEGREGTVKHMYKGTLFIYDETQTENCGFFCAKSQSCLNIKQLKSFKRDKKGSTSSYVDADEPMTTGEPSESRDFNGARRSRPINFVSPFSVGQTVRIRAGPLKGYLCRVTSIYRSKAIVKLDSLVKVLTVNLTDLSEVNTKNFGSSIRDTSSMISSDQFGSQDRPTDNGMAAPSGNNAWDSIAPANGRDSWPSCSTSMVAVPCHNADDERDNPQGADPWSSTLRSKDSEQSKDMDCWGKALSSSGQISAWNSSASVKEPTDSWEKGITRKEDDVLGKALASQYENISVANSGAWEENPGNANSGSSKNSMDAWNVKGKSTTANEGDGWGKSSFSPNKKDAQYNSRGWGNSVSSGNDQRSSWEKRADNREKANAEGDWHGNWNAWNVKGKSTTANEGDGWGKASFSPNKKDAQDNRRVWGNSVSSGNDQRSSWEKRADNREQANAEGDWHSNWNKPSQFGGWGHGQGRGRGKSLDYSERSGGADEQRNGWGRGKSIACDMSTSEQQKEFNRNKGSDWNNERQGVDEACGVAKQPSGWNNEERRNWNEAKNASFDQSGWSQGAAANETSSAKDNWEAPKPCGNQSSWNDDGSTWNKPKKHSLAVENTNTETVTDTVKRAKWSDDGKGWGNSADKSSCWAKSVTKTTDNDGSWTKLKVSGDVGKEENGNGNNWDRSKSYSDTKNTGWNDDGRSWSKPKESDGNNSHCWNSSGVRSENWNQGCQSSEWSRNCGDGRGGFDSGDCGGRSRNWNRGGRSFDRGESSEWNGNRGRSRGRGRNFNRFIGNQQNSHGRRELGGWRKDEFSSWNQGEQTSGGFQGSSGQGRGWSTDKGILETPKIKTDWQSSTCGSTSTDKEAGTGTWNQKPEGGWIRKGDETEKRSWAPPRPGAEFAGKDTTGWNAGPESSMNANTGKSCGWDKSNAPEKELWGPPRTWADRQTTWWEKGSADTWERGWEVKSSSREEGDSGNWNRNAGQKIWDQEKTQPSGSNSHGNAWGSSSGSWEKPRDGNGMQTTCWEKGSGSFMDSDTRNRGWEARSSSRGADDTTNWNRNAGQKTWNQEKTHPIGSNTSWEKPKDGNRMQTTGLEKGSGSSTDVDNWERGWEVKSSSREVGDSSNWNRNAGQKIWNQEKTQPSGSNPHGNKGHAWESLSGIWEKPKDGNGMKTTGWEKGSGSSMDADTRERGWEAKSSSREAGDSGNWNGNGGQKIWNQEKTQPSGSNTHGNKRNVWESSSGSWEKPKDGNGSNVGKGGDENKINRTRGDRIESWKVNPFRK